MPDRVMQGPAENRGCDNSPGGVRIHTNKIFDACKDKDCIENLRVYPTVSSQAVINTAFSVRPESATLLYAEVNVDEISFNRGYYTVDVTYFYRICGQSFPGGVPIVGLAVFDKRVILYGSEASVKVFSSDGCVESNILQTNSAPTAYVAAVDPIALNLRIGESCPGGDTELRSIPEPIVRLLGEDLNLSNCGRQLFVTLGQFSIIRLEREAQLTVDADRFFPVRECAGSSSDDDPCTLFGRVRFPLDEFFPPDSIHREESYREMV